MTAGEMNAITSKLQELEGDISQSKETQKQYDARLKAAQVRAQSLPLSLVLLPIGACPTLRAAQDEKAAIQQRIEDSEQQLAALERDNAAQASAAASVVSESRAQ